jgi:pimeloyl-ACP methyl ester carboxylesterase
MPIQAFKEQALLLGPRRSLVGVLAEGCGGAARTDRPALVILNSGIVHRVGANRMSVTLARALASAGHTVVRFDLSGVGDSDPRPDGLAPLDAAMADIQEVLDSLESTRRTRRFILAGLCSGADHSLIYAQKDARVVGAILLDPSIPRTLRHRAYHYRSRLLRRESWLNLLRGRNPLWRALRARVAGGGAAAEEPPGRQEELQRPEVRAYLERAYQTTLARGVQFLAALTGERSYYREQLLEAFPRAPFGGQLRLEYFKHSDHMFSAQVHSAHLIRVIVAWAGTTVFSGGVHESVVETPLPEPDRMSR